MGIESMDILFGEGKRVNVAYRGHTIETDQPKGVGGDGSAPAPFDLLLASIGSCAGFYVQTFCRRREIPLDAVKMTLNTETDPSTGLAGKITVSIETDSRFPAKYHEAPHKVVDPCIVKKQFMAAPNFEIAVS